MISPFLHACVVTSDASVAFWRQVSNDSCELRANMVYIEKAPDAMLNPRCIARAMAKPEIMDLFLITAPRNLVEIVTT